MRENIETVFQNRMQHSVFLIQYI